ncbi:hypothetical protein MMI99_06445, partial [Enterococcus cecorum]|nr:hypothetical protein [Enterococcus cecorum]
MQLISQNVAKMCAICVRYVGGVYPLWLKGFTLFVCGMWHSAPNGGVVVCPPLVFPFCSFLKPWRTFEKVPQTPQNFPLRSASKKM